LLQTPVGDVVLAVGAVFVVGVEGEALGSIHTCDGEIHNLIASAYETARGLLTALARNGERRCLGVSTA
jgi:hypothetical protein